MHAGKTPSSAIAIETVVVRLNEVLKVQHRSKPINAASTYQNESSTFTVRIKFAYFFLFSWGFFSHWHNACFLALQFITAPSEIVLSMLTNSNNSRRKKIINHMRKQTKYIPTYTEKKMQTKSPWGEKKATTATQRTSTEYGSVRTCELSLGISNMFCILQCRFVFGDASQPRFACAFA